MTATKARAVFIGALLPLLIAGPSAFAQPAEGSINISVADWLTPWEADRGGGWIAIPAGTTIPDDIEAVSALSGTIAAGTYDVYWAQNISIDPAIIASGVEVVAGADVTVRAATGILLDLADWVPARDPRTGWFGAILPDATAFDYVNALISGDGLYLPPGEYSVFYQPDSSTDAAPIWLGEYTVEAPFGGLGIEVSLTEGEITIIRTMESGPAEMVGLRAGDVILSIDDNDLAGLDLEEAVALLRGPPASDAVLTVARTKGDPIEIPVTRSTIEPDLIVRARSGIVLSAASDDILGEGGYWGVKFADGVPDQGLVNFSSDINDTPLLIGPAYYDVFWSIRGGPLRLIAEDVTAVNEIVTIEAPALK